MADTYVYMNGKRIKAVDNGDGTYSLSTTATIGDVDVDIDVVTQAALTDRSGTVTTGGTSQQLAAALATRRYLGVQNISAESLFVNFGDAAVVDSNSFEIAPGALLAFEGTFVPSGTVNIIGATTGSKFVAKEG